MTPDYPGGSSGGSSFGGGGGSGGGSGSGLSLGPRLSSIPCGPLRSPSILRCLSIFSARWRRASWEEASEDFRDHMAIPHQATFHRRSLFEIHGKFDEAFRICGDYELLLRELSGQVPYFIRDQIPVAMGAGGVSDNPGSLVRMTREFARARHMHGLTRVPPALSFAVFRARCRAWITGALGPGAADRVANLYRRIAGKPRL